MKKYIRITLAWLSMIVIADAEYITLGGRRVWGGYADAKATILAVDADGVPVADANVDARLFNSKYKDMGIGNRPFNGLRSGSLVFRE